VLRIRDILVRTRIRISGSVTDPDPAPASDPALDPCIFVSDVQDSNAKLFFLIFWGFLLFEATFT
jgi:hypothetical protein